MTESRYPTVDFPRDCHTVLRDCGLIEPYTEETDSWVALPVRWVQDQGGEFGIERGPYTLGHAEVQVLLEAIGDGTSTPRRARPTTQPSKRRRPRRPGRTARSPGWATG